MLNDSSEEEISDGASEEGGVDTVDVVGGAFADGPKARRQRRAALRAQRNKTRWGMGGWGWGEIGYLVLRFFWFG